MATVTTTIELGDRVKERLTGLEGIAVSITLYRTGCNHVGVKPEGLNKDGEPHKIQYFDEPELAVTQAKAMPGQFQASPEAPLRRAGGPSLYGHPGD